MIWISPAHYPGRTCRHGCTRTRGTKELRRPPGAPDPLIVLLMTEHAGAYRVEYDIRGFPSVVPVQGYLSAEKESDASSAQSGRPVPGERTIQRRLVSGIDDTTKSADDTRLVVRYRFTTETGNDRFVSSRYQAFRAINQFHVAQVALRKARDIAVHAGEQTGELIEITGSARLA